MMKKFPLMKAMRWWINEISWALLKHWMAFIVKIVTAMKFLNEFLIMNVQLFYYFNFFKPLHFSSNYSTEHPLTTHPPSQKHQKNSDKDRKLYDLLCSMTIKFQYVSFVCSWKTKKKQTKKKDSVVTRNPPHMAT